MARTDDELKQCYFLIQTVSDIEFYAVMNEMGDHEILRITQKDPVCNSTSCYYLGFWEEVRVAVVQTSMGVSGPGGSWFETWKALQVMPYVSCVFLVGVCGGRLHKVSLGDVVVSKAIHGCPDLKVTPGRFVNSSECLLNIDSKFYRFLSQDRKKDYVKFGIVLSGPWLIADTEMQEKLMQMCPEAIAFEMEGAGVARACQQNKVGCMIVKGVCDLANKHIADDWQPQAATNAARYLRQVIKFHPGWDCVLMN